MLESIVGKVLAVLAFCTLVLLAIALPQHEKGIMANSGDMRLSPAVDTKIGNATFHIERKGETVYMEPLLAPTFKMSLLAGDGVEPDSITKCGVYSRQTGVNMPESIVYTVTILKCGKNEYGINEVDFRFDGEGK